MSNYQLGCVEESKRWERIAAFSAHRPRYAEYARRVSARWAEKARA